MWFCHLRVDKRDAIPSCFPSWLVDSGAVKERQPARSADPWRAGENEDTYIDLHVGNLPSMPSPEQQEAVRKRLSDMFQPYGAIQVRVFSREKNFG